MLLDSLPAATLTLASWIWEPSLIIGHIALLIGYWFAAKRGFFPVSPKRVTMFLLGTLASYIALASPIDVGGDRYLFSLHMIQHMLLMMIAPPFWLIGIGGIRLGLGVGWNIWRRITRPWPALIIFTVILCGWHVPALYDSALRNEVIHVFEHLTFIAAGVIFWWPVVNPDSRTVSPLTKVAFLGLSGVAPTALGFLFAMATIPFYPYYQFVPRLWGISVTTDQQLAGVAMLGLGNLIYFVPISVIFWRLLDDTGDSGPLPTADPVA